MDKRIMDQIVAIQKDTLMHKDAVLNWNADGKVHLDCDFFIKQFLRSDYTQDLGYEWFNKEKTVLEVSIIYGGVTFFALIASNTVLENLVFIAISPERKQ